MDRLNCKTTGSVIKATLLAAILVTGSAHATGVVLLKNLYLNTTPLGANITSTQVNFPVVIRLDATNFTDGFASCAADGSNIRFMNKDGIELPREIVYYNATEKSATIFVLVDEILGNNGSQYITLRYDTEAPAYSAGPVFTSAAGFNAVWHLGENGNTTAGNYRDATPNGINGTGISMDANSKTAGIVGKAQYFDGVADYIEIPFNAKCNQTSYSISCWVRPDLVNSLYHTVFASRETGYKGYNLYLGMDNNWQFWMGTGADPWRGANASAAVQGTWALLTATYDGTTLRSYFNGALQNSATIALAKNNSRPFRIGSGNTENATGDLFFKGAIDEMAISGTVRSADWIKLAYENQKTGQTLVSMTPVATVILANDGRGTATVSSGTLQQFTSLTATIRAVPWTGYEFTGWTIVAGDPASITLSSPATQTTTVSVTQGGEFVVMANFKAGLNATAAYPNFAGAGDNMKVDGAVSIGAANSNPSSTQLLVSGRIQCDGLQIKDWLFKQKTPDYVFEPDYNLKSLTETAAYIKEHGHLPGVQSASDLQKTGLDITEFNMVLLKKIEELTLHAIAQQKEIDELKKKVTK